MFKTDAAPQPATSPERVVPWKTVFLLLRVAIGIAVLAYLAKSGQINFSSLIRLFHAWPITLTAVLFLLLDILMMSVRASLLFRTARLSLSLANSVQLNLVGFLFSTFLPGAAGGDIAKVVYATRENHGRRAEVATVLILDRLVGTFSLVLLPLFFAPFFPQLLPSLSFPRPLLYIDPLPAAFILPPSALFMFF